LIHRVDTVSDSEGNLDLSGFRDCEEVPKEIRDSFSEDIKQALKCSSRKKREILEHAFSLMSANIWNWWD